MITMTGYNDLLYMNGHLAHRLDLHARWHDAMVLMYQESAQRGGDSRVKDFTRSDRSTSPQIHADKC